MYCPGPGILLSRMSKTSAMCSAMSGRARPRGSQSESNDPVPVRAAHPGPVSPRTRIASIQKSEPWRSFFSLGECENVFCVTLGRGWRRPGVGAGA